jgi:hypothetical protein
VFAKLVRPGSASGDAQSSKVSEFIKDIVVEVDLDKLFPSSTISPLFGNGEGNILYLRYDPMAMASMAKIHREVSNTTTIFRYCHYDIGILSKDVYLAVPGGAPRLTYMGTPGIGKSFTLNFYALILIASGESFTTYREADQLYTLFNNDGSSATFEVPSPRFVDFAKRVKPHNMLVLVDPSPNQKPHNFELFHGLVMASGTKNMMYAPVKYETSTIHHVLRVPYQRQLAYIIHREVELRLGAHPYARELLKHLVDMVPPSLVVGPSISRALEIVDDVREKIESAEKSLALRDVVDVGTGTGSLTDTQMKEIVCLSYKTKLHTFFECVVSDASEMLASRDFLWHIFIYPGNPLDGMEYYHDLAASCVVVESNRLSVTSQYHGSKRCSIGLSPGSLLARLVLRQHLSRVKLPEYEGARVLKIIFGDDVPSLPGSLFDSLTAGVSADKRACLSQSLIGLGTERALLDSDARCASLRPPRLPRRRFAHPRGRRRPRCRPHGQAAVVKDADACVSMLQSLIEDLIDVIEEKYDETETDAQRPYCGLRNVGYPNPYDDDPSCVSGNAH